MFVRVWGFELGVSSRSLGFRGSGCLAVFCFELLCSKVELAALDPKPELHLDVP